MNYKNKRGITIVELIVVITILAVLGTIAFLSFQSYTISARDTVRVYDINNMKSALEYTQVELGVYAVPDDGVDVTYSGGVIVWNQGTFGTKARQQTKRLDIVPTDPLTGNEYTFSVTADKTEFELGAVTEGDDVVKKGSVLGEGAYAAGNYKAYIAGNYNGQIAKASSGGVDYVFALPSIINTDIGDADLSSIIQNKKLAVRGYKNIPHSYGIIDNGGTSGELDFVNESNMVVFTGSFDDLKDSESSRITLVSNLQKAYSGTTIKDIPAIQEIVSNEIDEGSPSVIIQNLAITIVNQYFITQEHKKIKRVSGGSSEGGVVETGDPYDPIAGTCPVTTGGQCPESYYFKGANGSFYAISGNQGELFLLDDYIDSINKGPILSAYMYVFKDKLYISQALQSWARKLYSFDTESTLVKDFGSSYLNKGVVLGDKFVFFSGNPNALDINVTEGIEGDLITHDLNIDRGDSNSWSNREISVFNNEIYFYADDGVHGKELWKTDGASTGTLMVKDIVVGAGDSTPELGHLATEFEGKLYFNAAGAVWYTDGTELGTQQLTTFEANFSVLNSTLYLATYNTIYELSGGIANAIIDAGDVTGSTVYFHSNTTYVCGGKIFYGGASRLVASDGTLAGTVALTDVFVDFRTNNSAMCMDGKLLFAGRRTSDGYGVELYSSDGTSSGTTIVKNIDGSSSSALHSYNVVFMPFNDKAWFVANDGTHGNELWYTDGTSNGTELFHDIVSGSSSGVSSYLQNGELEFYPIK